MPIPNPRTPYERAYNDWVYGGGADRGEPMPRARDYPSSADAGGARQEEARGAYDPRTAPPPPTPSRARLGAAGTTDPRLPTLPPPEVYTSGPYGARAARPYRGPVAGQFQPPGQRRPRPRSGYTSLGALNRR